MHYTSLCQCKTTEITIVSHSLNNLNKQEDMQIHLNENRLAFTVKKKNQNHFHN